MAIISREAADNKTWACGRGTIFCGPRVKENYTVENLWKLRRYEGWRSRWGRGKGMLKVRWWKERNKRPRWGKGKWEGAKRVYWIFRLHRRWLQKDRERWGMKRWWRMRRKTIQQRKEREEEEEEEPKRLATEAEGEASGRVWREVGSRVRVRVCVCACGRTESRWGRTARYKRGWTPSPSSSHKQTEVSIHPTYRSSNRWFSFFFASVPAFIVFVHFQMCFDDDVHQRQESTHICHQPVTLETTETLDLTTITSKSLQPPPTMIKNQTTLKLPKICTNLGFLAFILISPHNQR